ncbi:Retrovirus-related Pol polyprotein from transposon opus [Gossypium australe]|uniref:Retrovirus-related Pol polyprotein from transposon opus n=1 Tax=Gossypium australe TaxID=47621 RepID=A0A5B6WP26_9ROSI|nr:Retrovirus-related Pol polyprotein from transposon opus [Gossypium australe]
MPRYANYVNYIAQGVFLINSFWKQNNRIIHEGKRTTQKILQLRFYWPTMNKDVYNFVQKCDRCQRTGLILKKDEMPQAGTLEVEIFGVWEINFMGLFSSSFENQYILLVIDYVSK